MRPQAQAVGLAHMVDPALHRCVEFGKADLTVLHRRVQPVQPLQRRSGRRAR